MSSGAAWKHSSCTFCGGTVGEGAHLVLRPPNFICESCARRASAQLEEGSKNLLAIELAYGGHENMPESRLQLQRWQVQLIVSTLTESGVMSWGLGRRGNPRLLASDFLPDED